MYPTITPSNRTKGNALFRGLLLLLIVLSFTATIAQNKTDLERQRNEINDKISLTKRLIKDSETKQKSTTNQLSILNEQIKYREDLLNNISADIKNIDGEIAKKDAAISSLQKELENLRSEYANMIYQAYRNRSSYDKLMYIFAAEDFNQAYKRFKITQRYAEVRKEQVATIEKTQKEIEAHIQSLQLNKTEKKKLASEKENEKNSIASDKVQQQSKLTALLSEEKSLRDQQKKQENDRRKLTAKIEEIIKAEIEAARKKEEEARKAAAKATNNHSSSSTNAPAPRTSKTLELAPEVKIMNADFEKNKGSLPWPVSSGIITTHFGRQAHQSIAGIEINNNGVDFTTEKDGSALAAFSGTVSSIFAIPGAGQNIIVTHGSYKTVYSGLGSVNVKVGDKVDLRQKLGAVQNNGEDFVLHFEIWKVNAEAGVAQNPELWIKKR